MNSEHIRYKSFTNYIIIRYLCTYLLQNTFKTIKTTSYYIHIEYNIIKIVSLQQRDV